MGRWTLVAASLVAAFANRGLAQSVPPNATRVLAPLVGPFATPAPGQESTAGFATDLGLTDVHEGQLRIIFGDSLAPGVTASTAVQQDDVQGVIALDAFPDGAAVDRYLAKQLDVEGQPAWRRPGPSITFRTDARGRPAVIRVHDGGVNGALVNTGLFKAPIAAFSNAKSGAASGFFTIYGTSVPVECSGGPVPSCDDGFQCMTGLGKLGSTQQPDAVPCMLGQAGCLALAGGGMCVDVTSSLFDPSGLPGLVQSLVWQHQVGNADPIQHEVYYSRAWHTNKFTNLTARTVNDFDPARPGGLGNDYRPAQGSNPGAKLLLWGRPSYAGTTISGYDLKLYFGFVDLPSYSATADFEWAPQYFAGWALDGTPLFSPLQVDARALDLGGMLGPDHEVWDVVNQMAVSWVAPLQRWVMLYGGGTNDSVGNFLTFGQGPLVQHDPAGAIHVRFAEQPWGPWSAPQQLLEAGNPFPLDAAPASDSLYGPSGILSHPRCIDPSCALQDTRRDPNDYGFLYGVNIIDRWTQETADGANIFWNVSTWDPYQVLLLKTQLQRAMPGPAAGTSGTGGMPAAGPVGAVEGAAGAAMPETQPVGEAGAGAQPPIEIEPGAVAVTQREASAPPSSRKTAWSCTVSTRRSGAATWRDLAPLLGVVALSGARLARRRRTSRRPCAAVSSHS